MNVFEIEEKAKEILGDDAKFEWDNLENSVFVVLCRVNTMYLAPITGNIYLTDGEYFNIDEKEIEQHIRALQKGLEFLRLVRKKNAQDGLEYVKDMKESGFLNEKWANDVLEKYEQERCKQG